MIVTSVPFLVPWSRDAVESRRASFELEGGSMPDGLTYRVLPCTRSPLTFRILYALTTLEMEGLQRFYERVNTYTSRYETTGFANEKWVFTV